MSDLDDVVRRAGADGDGERTRVGHWLVDDCDVYIGRGGSAEGISIHLLTAEPEQYGRFGNPYTLEDHSREESIKLYAAVLDVILEDSPRLRREVADLHGKTLGCWCRRVDQTEPACHGDVLAFHADRLASSSDGQ